jgi:hypothetical protein
MKKLSVTHIMIYISVFTLLTACTEPIDIELDSSFSRLSVFGEISTDSTVHNIRLTRSADYFYNQPSVGVSDAIVKISDGENEIFLTENPLNPGNYQTPSGFFGIPGKTYVLVIENVDIDKDGVMESYSASSFLPFLASQDSIRIKYSKNSFYEGTEIMLYAQDPAESIDYYAFKIIKNGILQTDSLPEIIAQDDLFFNGKYTNGITVQFLDEAKEGEQVFPGDTITLEMLGITKEYYIFIIEAQTELFGSNPLFSGPPANISTNISNGALGFFGAVNINRSSVIAPAKP